MSNIKSNYLFAMCLFTDVAVAILGEVAGQNFKRTKESIRHNIVPLTPHFTLFIQIMNSKNKKKKSVKTDPGCTVVVSMTVEMVHVCDSRRSRAKLKNPPGLVGTPLPVSIILPPVQNFPW